MTNFHYDRLDALIHSRLRTVVIAALANRESAEFTVLRDLTGSTDGNIFVHLRKLEEAGYVRSAQRLVERSEVTCFALTARGRRAFDAYLDHLLTLAGRQVAADRV
jgi:DNA-binding MarR family transcriptional regulator